MDDSLVQQFEELMAKVSTTRNITQQKEDEIKRLTMEAQKRAAAVPVGQSDAVVKLRQEVQQRQVDSVVKHVPWILEEEGAVTEAPRHAERKGRQVKVNKVNTSRVHASSHDIQSTYRGP